MKPLHNAVELAAAVYEEEARGGMPAKAFEATKLVLDDLVKYTNHSGAFAKELEAAYPELHKLYSSVVLEKPTYDALYEAAYSYAEIVFDDIRESPEENAGFKALWAALGLKWGTPPQNPR